jgi:hypothetical protein
MAAILILMLFISWSAVGKFHLRYSLRSSFRLRPVNPAACLAARRLWGLGRRGRF